jgi:hypothetical protein
MDSSIPFTVDLPALLIKEQEELNNWSRTSLQIYFAWYTVFLTLNGAGLAWLFQNGSRSAPGSRLVFGIFGFWNLLGIGASVAVLTYVRQTRDRLTKIYQELLGDRKCNLRPQVPMPSQAAQIAIILNIAAMASLLGVWSWFAVHR